MQEPIVIPYNIRLGYVNKDLNIRYARRLELDSIYTEGLNKQEYYYLVNTNPQNKVISLDDRDVIDRVSINIIYANIGYATTIEYFERFDIREAIFPHAKQLHSIFCPNLRRLELPDIEEIGSDAFRSSEFSQALTELVLPTRLCINRDTLQQKLIEWGIGKFIKQIIPQSDSTSFVRLDNTFWISLESEIKYDSIYNKCPYDKTELRISSQISEIEYDAFDGAANLESLSVDMGNEVCFSFGNAVYAHGSYEVAGYAPNASELYLLACKRYLLIGENVKNIYTFMPETMYDLGIFSMNNLNNVTLYVPQSKLQTAIIELKDVFKEIKPLNVYQILLIDISFTIKELLSIPGHLETFIFAVCILFFLVLLDYMPYNRGAGRFNFSIRPSVYAFCSLYPFTFLVYYVVFKMLGSTTFRLSIPTILAFSLAIVIAVIYHKRNKDR